MALKVAFQMDPIERIDIRGDSTFALLLEAQWRGHDVFYYTPDNLSLRDGKLIALGHSLTVEDKPGDHYRLAHPREEDLSKFDVVHLRQDPPFDMAYITTTHLLERIHPKTLVVNNPAAVRNAPEKVFVLDFLDLMPPTLVTRSAEAIKAFREKYKDIVVKPLYGNGGAAVLHFARRHQSQLADRALGPHIPRADYGAAISAGGARRRQAHYPRRGRDRRCHQPRTGTR